MATVDRATAPAVAVTADDTVHVERVGAGAWERARTVRLRALEDAPDAYWSTLSDEGALSVPQWRSRLDRLNAATFLAVVDGDDVGIVVGAAHHAQPSEAGLYSMWVASQVRGRGVGDALIAAVVDWARAAGYRRCGWTSPTPTRTRCACTSAPASSRPARCCASRRRGRTSSNTSARWICVPEPAATLSTGAVTCVAGDALRCEPRHRGATVCG